MHSQEIQQQVEEWAKSKDFTAPYGILTGSGQAKGKRGMKYLSVTFGRARTLDATVEIYNRKFMIVRTSRHGSQLFKSVDDLMQFLETL